MTTAKKKVKPIQILINQDTFAHSLLEATDIDHVPLDAMSIEGLRATEAYINAFTPKLPEFNVARWRSRIIADYITWRIQSKERLVSRNKENLEKALLIDRIADLIPKTDLETIKRLIGVVQ